MEKISFVSRIIYFTLRQFKGKQRLFRSLLSAVEGRKDQAGPLKHYSKRVVHRRRVDGFELLTLEPDTMARHHLFFLHGGAYVSRAYRGHWSLIEMFVKTYSMRVSFLDYPLSPPYQVMDTVSVTEHAWTLLQEEYPGDKFSLMGDSAGGGLALVLLQQLVRKGTAKRPKKTVLLSPWLDVSLENPDISEYEDLDVLLDLEGLRKCGILYAGKRDLKDPLVSPLYGPMDDLGDLLLFVSTHEILYPDCMRFKEKCTGQQGTQLQIAKKEGMVHDWPILPIPERKDFIRKAGRFLISGTKTSE